MMLKESTIKNLELEMYEKRLTDVKIEMEKTRRRMVALDCDCGVDVDCV